VKEVWLHWVQKPKTNRPAIPTVGCFNRKLSAPLRWAFTAVSRMILSAVIEPLFLGSTWSKVPSMNRAVNEIFKPERDHRVVFNAISV